MGLIRRTRRSIAANVLNASRKPFSKSLAGYNLNSKKAANARSVAQSAHSSARIAARAMANYQGLEYFESATDASRHLATLHSRGDVHFQKAVEFDQRARPFKKGAKKAMAIRNVGRKVAHAIAGKK